MLEILPANFPSILTTQAAPFEKLYPTVYTPNQQIFFETNVELIDEAPLHVLKYHQNWIISGDIWISEKYRRWLT